MSNYVPPYQITTLSLEQVTAVLDGKRVLGLPSYKTYQNLPIVQ